MFGANEMNGMIDRVLDPVFYIDANPFIYAVEGDDNVAQPVNELFAVLRNRPAIAVTSELTLAEVLPKAGPTDRRQTYFDLIVWGGIFDLRPVTREILVETADYRRSATRVLPDGRTVMPKLPDAIHVVTAARSGCRLFLSTDGRIKLPSNMRLVEADREGIATLIREVT